MIKKSSLIIVATLLLITLLALPFILTMLTNYLHQSQTSAGVSPHACQQQQVGSATNHGGNSAGCQLHLLVFSKTGAFRHASIKDGIVALKKLAADHHVTIDFTEDATRFTDANLAQYNAVVFLLTSGEILDDDQQAAFERYIRAGGGYVGVHSASDTEYKWLWYGKLVGAYFHSHPRVQQATIDVIDHHHPSTATLPDHWVRSDEWYNFATNPRDSVHVLMTVDEKTYTGGAMGAFHPISWYHAYDGGRSWYTALGHTSESYYDPLFLAHLWGGIMYAAGA